MNITVLGTGMVGRTIAARLIELNHHVLMGTGDVDAKLAQDDAFKAWSGLHPVIQLATFKAAADQGEMIINATSGKATLSILNGIGAQALDQKVLIDISNPLDFSHGMPPSLFVSNTDSLGEQIQRALPNTRVVKTLNTVTADIMVNPQLLKGEHDVFVSGDDADAKAQVIRLLKAFGWAAPIDLGGIATARATEMLLPIWLQLYGVLQTPLFNIKVVTLSQ